MDLDISIDDRKWLLSLARKSIKSHLDGVDQPTLEPPVSERLFECEGAFVSLHIESKLRGCVGYVEASKPVWETIATASVAAAFNDTRFPSLSIDELEKCEIEISVLTKPSPIESWQNIELGKNGIILIKDPHRALLLPQVATEQGWDLPKTLTQLSLKAGMAPDDWKHDARFEVFESIVFSEE